MGQGDGSDEIGFNQAMADFLPNTTFLQPPGWVVHSMVCAITAQKLVYAIPYSMTAINFCCRLQAHGSRMRCLPR
jgi:hypothetical protein